MKPDEEERGKQRHPLLWKAWLALSALKATNAATPAGSLQVLALAELLADETLNPSSRARRMIDAWKKKKLKVVVDEAAFAKIIGDAG